MNRRQFALLLAMTPGVGGRSVTRILARNDLLSIEPRAFFRLSQEALREEYRLNAKQAEAIKKNAKNPEDHLEPLLQRLDSLGVQWMTLVDAHYPERLELFDPDPPGFLFAYGNTRLLEAKTFSVLSSRHTTRAGLELMEKLCEDGVLAGEVLVSGHDTPEYQRSAIVPLRWGSPRILVLDRGLFTALGPDLKEEPFRAARLWRFQFDPKTDLVVSPFRPDNTYNRGGNTLRDRLIAGLAMRGDFVEVSPGGNMEKMAKMLLKAGRGVRISDRSTGYRSLCEAGAVRLED